MSNEIGSRFHILTELVVLKIHSRNLTLELTNYWIKNSNKIYVNKNMIYFFIVNLFCILI